MKFWLLTFLDFIPSRLGVLSVKYLSLLFSIQDEHKNNYSDHFHEAIQHLEIWSAYLRAIHYYYSQETYLRCQVSEWKAFWIYIPTWNCLPKCEFCENYCLVIINPFHRNIPTLWNFNLLFSLLWFGFVWLQADKFSFLFHENWPSLLYLQ